MKLVAAAAALLWLAALGGGAPGAAAAAGLALTEAQLVATLDGREQPPRRITLPLHWDVEYEGRSGHADLRLSFHLAPDALAAGTPMAMSITRLGVAYEIDVNGEVVAAAGSLVERDRFYAKHPVRVALPARLLRAGRNDIQIRLRADAGYRAGLAPVIVGPRDSVMPAAQRSAFWRSTVPQAASVLSLLVGCFCMLLWWQQRDALYAWAGIGELLWAVTVADTVVETVPLPWPYWGLSLLLLRAAWAWALYAIGEQVFGRRPTAERRLMMAVQIAAPLCVVAMAALQSTRPLMVWYAANFLLWFWVIVRLAWQLRGQASAERVLVWLAIVAVVIASARDVTAARIDAALYAESAWAKYLAPAVGVALMWIVSMRFGQARRDVLQLNASLARRVDDKERELRASFERLGDVERSRAVLAERERILREMHDGIGADLATAVQQLEGGQAQPLHVAQALRESMLHLKLAVDAMSLPAGDVNALLASLRYRLQPRIENSGLAMRWDVDALPHWAAGNDERMRHLQFLLLEAVSNAVQHAHAATLTISARGTPQGIELTVRDDGRGIHDAAGSGLSSMRDRAQSLGAVLTIDDAGPGTRVRVELPIA